MCIIMALCVTMDMVAECVYVCVCMCVCECVCVCVCVCVERGQPYRDLVISRSVADRDIERDHNFLL